MTKVKQQASYFSSLSFNVFIYKMGIIIVPPTEDIRVKGGKNMKVPSTEQGSIISQPFITAWIEVPLQRPMC